MSQEASPPVFDAKAIERRVQRNTLAWFLLVASLLIGTGAFSFLRLRNTIEGYVQQQALSVGNNLHAKLQITDQIYQKLVSSAVNVLKNESLEFGSPRLAGDLVDVRGQMLPRLQFGDVNVASNPRIVNEVVDQVGGTATIFVRDGNRFVRLITSVRTSDGSSAVGTVLNPSGAAVKNLLAGETYLGVADILGIQYYTAYVPIKTERGAVIGAWYAGYPIDAIDEISRLVRTSKILADGFLVLKDSSKKPLYRSEHVSQAELDSVLKGLGSGDVYPRSVAGGYEVYMRLFAPWRYNIMTVTSRSAMNRLALQLTWGVMGLK